jgi:hypothetical protein
MLNKQILNKMSTEIEQMKAEIEALKLENEKIKGKLSSEVKFKVAEKTGAISIYGLRAGFPVTLYSWELQLLMSKTKEIEEFIEENKDRLASQEEHKTKKEAERLLKKK